MHKLKTLALSLILTIYLFFTTPNTLAISPSLRLHMSTTVDISPENLNVVDMERYIDGEPLDEILKAPTVLLDDEALALIKARISTLESFLDEIGS